MAHSGYLGYFIGLSALKPSKALAYFGRRLFQRFGTSRFVECVGSRSVLLLALVGVLSYAFLVAAILKARALSPNREQNFATRIFLKSDC
jgi:RsiW-degrading membrane proteinase PrsW (M82 family)